MRDFKGMKRQRNRNRGSGGGNNGGKPQHNANRAFDSNGPDNVKVRGAAQHIYEKYQQLARDAGSGGDRVLAENYLQHAEHYFRVLRAMQPQRPISEIVGRDNFASGYDIDFEDESQNQFQAESPEGDGEVREERTWNDRPQGDQPQNGRQQDGRQQNDYRQQDGRQQDGRQQNDGRPRDDRPRDDRPRDDRYRNDQPRYNRDDRPRDDRPRDDRPRDDRPRDDRPRDDRPREDRPRYRDERPRESRQDRDPLSVVEPNAAPLPTAAAAPVREPEPQGDVLRSEDGGVSHAPAFLQARAEPRAEATEEPAGEARRPRRRRAPKSFEAGDATSAEADEG